MPEPVSETERDLHQAVRDADESSERFRRQYTEIATLAGGLAHEIRNPLSTIRMNLQLLSEDLQLGDDPRHQRIARKLDTIRRECGRLDDLLGAFLQFARAGEPDLQERDLSSLVAEFVDFFQAEAKGHHIEISPHLSASLPPVRVDPNLLRIALVNLARNAEQAMPHGGQLELQTYARDGRVHLEVIDNGPGMPEAVRCRLFDVFFSTKQNGTGLGLPTVRKIAEAHQATIHCDSEPGRGTRFTLSFPSARTSRW
jgi:two-component system, NtrC family, sensor histidine kinase HydH